MGRADNKLVSKVSFLKTQKGFTLIEVIIVVAILALLIAVLAGILNPRLQLGRSRDSRRKADLKKIMIGLEDYAGDHGCYPDAIYESTSNCQPTDEFGHYLNPIPCDPLTHKPYSYFHPTCKVFWLSAFLEAAEDGTANYILTSSNVRTASLPTPTLGSGELPTLPSGPTPTPDQYAVGYYGCFNGQCLPLTSSNECAPHYLALQTCSGSECCTFGGVNQCLNPENQCR